MDYGPPTPVDLAEIFESGQYSDLKIKCGDREFPVHKAIVCTQSKFFRAAIGDGFEAGTTGIINLSDHDIEDVCRMLSFMYSSHYLCPEANLAAYVGVYAMGNMFDLPQLSQYAKCKFNDSLTHLSDEDPMTFISFIPQIYESTPESDRGLRDAAVLNARRKYDYYTANLDYKDAFNEVLQSTWPFTKDLLTAFSDAYSWRTSPRTTW